MTAIKASAFEHIETSLLKKEIAILKQEKILEREELLKDIAHRLTKKNMAFPIIREIIDLPEQELRGIFYGGVDQRSARRSHKPKVGGSNPSPAITQEEKHDG
jgi:hypothetical protein